MTGPAQTPAQAPDRGLWSSLLARLGMGRRTGATNPHDRDRTRAEAQRRAVEGLARAALGDLPLVAAIELIETHMQARTDASPEALTAFANRMARAADQIDRTRRQQTPSDL